MQPEFSIDVLPERSMLRITLSGFFSRQDIDRFIAARDAAQRKLPGGAGAGIVLVDVRRLSIQAQDCVAAFAGLLADRKARSRKIAFVVDRNLSRMQIARAARGRGPSFHCMTEAEQWLLSPDEHGGVTGLSRDRHPNDAEPG